MKPEICLTFLGTSTSTGVPVIGCRCETCTSTDPKLKRSRSSIHLQTPESSILVDTGPDLREQALRENLTQVDSVLYTHSHLDHITGFDELRAFCWHRDHPLPIYGSPVCLDEIKRIFQWAFLPSNTYRGYVRPKAVETHGPFSIGKLVITPVAVEHGNVDTQGYRFDYPGVPSIAYLPDVKTIPDSSVPLLEGIGVLIIDALRERDHPTHMNLKEAISTAKALKAQNIYLTHISHELDVSLTLSELPKGFDFAYDGLKLNFSANKQSQ